jgi:hypothetical protein
VNWHELIRVGVDPHENEERQRLTAQRKRANTFAAVVEDYIRHAVIGPDPKHPKQRRGARVVRELRSFFVPLWGDMRVHAVPLTDAMLAIFDELPRFNRGDFLFTLSHGAKPAAVNDKIKKVIDVRMLRSLRALARMRGEDPARVKLNDWVNHDIRRTVLSRRRANNLMSAIGGKADIG